MTVHKDIVYVAGDNPKHTLDLYIDSQVAAPADNRKLPLAIYIHGGAWRTGDKSEVIALCDGVLCAAGGYIAVAAISYRLSVRDDKSKMHPMHLDDVAAAVGFLLSETPYPGSDKIDRSNVFLVGHSAGALMATMLVLQPHPTIATSLARIRGVLGVGGIYDIPRLLETNPSYADFINMAFTEDQHKTASPSYAVDSTVISRKGMRFLLVNSTTDELINSLQAADMVTKLIGAGFADVGLIVQEIGTHYGELESKRLWRIIADFVLATQEEEK
ncbi:hypothetical protein EV175_000871 [Coemansia sp. RSA 1933]|nr:hypothetical protein EV175_000871 [Coemansia sp. RSA 1933]